jgi:hypothetical protein
LFDILYSAIHLSNGLQKPQLPGLIALAPSRHPARGREEDLFFGYAHITGLTNAAVGAEDAWLKETAALFYKTPGTVTAAMRVVIEKMNSELMLRNLEPGQEGSQLQSALTLGVVHHGQLFFTTMGGMRTFVITASETIDSLETEFSSRSLGTSQNITPRFQQVEIHANDLVIISPAMPSSWTSSSLAGSAGLSVEALRRRLSNQVGSELKASLFRFVEGSGRVLPLHLRFAPEESEANKPSAPQPATSPAPNPEPVVYATIASEPLPPDEIPILSTDSAQAEVKTDTPFPSTAAGLSSGQAEQLRPEKRQVEITRPSEQLKSEAGRRKEATARKQPPDRAVSGSADAARTAARAVKGVESFSLKLRRQVATWFRQTLPGSNEPFAKLSTPTMLLISILVPLLVVAIGASFYERQGKGQEFERSLEKAAQFSTLADTQKSDAVSRLASLQQAMYWLDQAKQYGSSADYETLRNQVQGNLDALNGIQRLNFSPAIDPPLESTARISQMVATATDLYLLESTSGKVYRYFYAGTLFQRDTSFDCGPNANPLGNSIGAIVDILALPSGNSLGATLAAIDGAGNIEYCIPSSTGMVNALQVPDAGWGKIQSIAYYNGTLYVLDSAMNAVYRYDGFGTDSPDKPVLFFDEQIPPLGEATDIEVNADELYILRSSGELVECTYSALKDYKPTECLDPAPYGDMRTGQTPQAVNFPDVKFVQMHMTAAPDSSLYMLDANSKTVYHFSLQRNLQKVFLPSFSSAAISKLEPTAFAVSPGRLIFVAFQNEIQFTQLP